MISSAFHPAIGGAENQALELGAALVRRGVEVHVLTRNWPGVGPEDLVRGVVVHRRGPAYALDDDTITASRLDSLRAAWAWWGALRQQHACIDIIHAQQVFSQASVGLWAKRCWDKPLVVKVPGERSGLALVSARGRRLGPAVDAWVVPNPEVAAMLRRTTLPPRRVLDLPNGVRRFEPQGRQPPQGPPRVLFVGRLVALKRLEVLLEAWPAVRAAFPAARLDVVGYGEARAAWEAQAARLGLVSAVTFHGRLPQDQAWELLRQAQVFVQCSESEGVSNALLEAVAAGVPAVVTDISGNRAVVPDQGHGHLVGVGDVGALGLALIDALRHPIDAEARASRARARVERELGIDHVAERYLELYRRLLWSRSGARGTGPRRLVVFSQKQHWRRGREIFTDGGFPRQVAALGGLFDQTRLCVPVVAQGAAGGTSVTGLGMQVRALAESARRPGPRAKLALLWNLVRALPLVNDELRRATALHVRLPSYEGLLALALVRLRPRPVLVWIGGNWMERIVLTRNSALRRWVSRSLPALLERLMRGHVVFVMGDQFAEGLSGVGSWHRDVATSVWRSELVDPSARRWPVRQGQISLIFVGRLSIEKGLAPLFLALQRPEWQACLARQASAYSLTIVGSGPLEAELRAQAAAAALPVSFTGLLPRAAIGPVLADADIFVLPSLADASPKVLVEALVHGLPVVASRVGGVPRLLGDGQRGLLVAPADAAAWAAALARMVEDTDLRRRLQAAGHAWAREQTLEAQRERFREALTARYGPGSLSHVE